MSEETTGSHQPHESEANPCVRNENLLERISVIQSGLHAEAILAEEPEQDNLPDATGQLLSRVTLQTVAAEGRETRNQLLLENVGLVRRIAGNIWNRNIRQVQNNLEFNDLMQYGIEAMIDGFAKFSLEKAEETRQERLSIGQTVNHKTLFATYVGDRVYRSIVQTLANETVIKIPDSVHVYISSVNGFQHELTKKYQRDVSFEEALLAKNWPILDGKEDTLQLYRNRQTLVRTGRRVLHVLSLSETINRNDLRPLDPNDTLEAIIKEVNPEDLALERFEEHTDNLDLLKKIIQLARKNRPVLTERELFVFAQLAINELRHHEVIALLDEREGHTVSRQMVSLLNDRARKKMRAAAELLQEPDEELTEPEEPKLGLEYYRALRRRTLLKRQQSQAEEVIITEADSEDYTQEPEIALTEVSEPDDPALDLELQLEEIAPEEANDEPVPEDPATLLHTIAMRFGKGAKDVREGQADILINHFLQNGTMGRRAGQDILTRLQRMYIKSLAGRVPRDRQAEAVMLFFLGDDKNKILPMPFTELVEFLSEREHANPETIPDFVLWVLQQELTWITQQLSVPSAASPRKPRSKQLAEPTHPEPSLELEAESELESLEKNQPDDPGAEIKDKNDDDKDNSQTVEPDLDFEEPHNKKRLSPEEEAALGKRIEIGVLALDRLSKMSEVEKSSNTQLVKDLEWLIKDGKFAKDFLIDSKRGLATYIARRHYGRGVDVQDLIQEAIVGVIRSVEKYDYQKDDFSTKTGYAIRSALLDAIAKQRTVVRVPKYMQDNIYRMRRAQDELSITLGRRPKDQELASHLEITAEDLKLWMETSISNAVSLNAPFSEDGGELGDLIADDEVDVSGSVVDTAEKERMLQALSTIKPQYAFLLRMSYGLDDNPKDTDEIAQIMGINNHEVRALLVRALDALRAATFWLAR